MSKEVQKVLDGKTPRAVVQSSWEDFLPTLPTDCASLIFGSPPYRLARTYGIDFKLADQAWVDWMVKLWGESQRISIGLVGMVVEGQTKKFKYTAEPMLLGADLHRAGFYLRKPPIFNRVGIPGSGGPDWLRNDYEFIICTSRGKLPWSDNTAAGHKPKWAPGGEMSYRNSSGTRRNQWGGWHDAGNQSGSRKANGERSKAGRPSHVLTKRTTRGYSNGDTQDAEIYTPPALANPGNVIKGEALGLPSLNIIDILGAYGKLTSTNSSQILRQLRKAIVAKDLPRWWARIYSRIQEETVLQSCLPWEGLCSPGWSEAWGPASQGPKDCTPEKEAGEMRTVREGIPLGGAPQGRHCDQQRNGKSGGALPLVSQEGTQNGTMLDSELQAAFLRTGLLLEALPEIQNAWQSISEKIQARYPDESSNLIKCLVGGGVMGNPLCHANEAPYPEALAEFFVLSFCPPGGLVIDPFTGSGTTGAVALRHGRRFLGCDIRQSQVDLASKRIAGETPLALMEGER